MPDLALPTARPLPVRSGALTMVGRSLRLTRRQLDALLTALMLPIMLMLVFVYLFGDSPWVALTWCGGILVASIALASVFFRRRTA